MELSRRRRDYGLFFSTVDSIDHLSSSINLAISPGIAAELAILLEMYDWTPRIEVGHSADEGSDVSSYSWWEREYG